MPRVLAAFLVVTAALAAQDPELPPLELPRAEAWFDDPEQAERATALVVVKRGHRPWVRTVGHVDAARRVALEPVSWVPLGRLSELLLREAVRIGRERHGLDPNATLRDSAPAVVAGLDPVFGVLTWAQLLADRETPALYYERRLDDEATPRPLAEVIASHVFRPRSGGSSRGDLWAALVQRGVEVRCGAGWDELVSGPIAAALGASVAARRPSVTPAWSGADGTRSWRWTDREVAAAGGAWLRLDTAHGLLTRLLDRTAEELLDPTLGGFTEGDDALFATSHDPQRHGPGFLAMQSAGDVDTHVRVYPSRDVAMLVVTAGRYPAWQEAAFRVAEDLFRQPGEDWSNEPQLRLGGRGGRYSSGPDLRRLASNWLGSYAGTVETLGGPLPVRLEVRSDDPKAVDCFLDGVDVVERSEGERYQANVTVQRPAASDLHFVLHHTGDEVLGHVRERIGRSTLPWRVRLVRAGALPDPLPPVRELVEDLELEARIAPASDQLPAARALGLWREGDAAWVAVAGRPDPNADAVLSRDDRLPFGALSQAVTRRALERLAAAGRIDLGATAESWTGEVGGRPAGWSRATLRALLTGADLPIYFRHVADPAARRSFTAAADAHAFLWPDWILPDPEGEFGLGLVIEALECGAVREMLDLAAEVTDGGLAVIAGPRPHAVRIVDGDAVRPVRFSEVPLAFNVEGTADAALELGAELLERRRFDEEERPWGAWDLGDFGDRGLTAVGWEDDRAGAIRLRVWPDLSLVLFAFDAGGETGWIDAVTDAVLERAEPRDPSPPVSGQWNTTIGIGDGHKTVALYAAEWRAGDATFAISLRNAWPKPELTVDGRRLDIDLRRYVGEDIVLHAPLGDGRELWIAVRHNFFATGLVGVGWLVEPGAALLPYPMALRRR